MKGHIILWLQSLWSFHYYTLLTSILWMQLNFYTLTEVETTGYSVKENLADSCLSYPCIPHDISSHQYKEPISPPCIWSTMSDPCFAWWVILNRTASRVAFLLLLLWKTLGQPFEKAHTVFTRWWETCGTVPSVVSRVQLLPAKCVGVVPLLDHPSFSWLPE